MKARRRIEVKGTVQGVGYRYFALTEARRLGLVGWAANTDSGSVVVEAEGEPTDLDHYVDALRRGPSMARVISLAAHDLPCQDDADFTVSLRW